jgi:3-hydroxyisobutyrate dehydrogenase
MAKIAFVGLGAMGSRMAGNLLKAGHTVTVWNRDPSKATPLAALGAVIAGTPKATVPGAEIVIAMVRDDEASQRVWLDPESGALGGLGRQAIAIESSTLTVGWVKMLSAAAAARGVSFLDAPVVGSRPQAEAAELIFLAGGDSGVLARAEPVLRVMGSAVHHVGPNGAGAALKLGINALFGIQVAALAEVLALLRVQGVSSAKAAEIIGSTPVASPAAKGAAQSMLAGAFAPMFPVELVEKDFSYVAEMGNGLDAPAPMAAAARAVMNRAIDAGFRTDNITGIVRLYGGLG